MTIDESAIDQVLDSWRKSDIADCRALPGALADRIRRLAAVRGLFNLSLLWRLALKIANGVDRAVLVAMAAAYVESASATDYAMRVENLSRLSEVFGAVDPGLSSLTRGLAGYLGQFTAEADRVAADRTKEVTKMVSDVLKVYSGKHGSKKLRDLSSVQLNRQIKKVEAEAMEVLSQPIAQMAPLRRPNAIKGQDDKEFKLQIPKFSTSAAIKSSSAVAEVFHFKAGDGSDLGSSSEMRAKMARPASEIRRSLSGLQAPAEQVCWNISTKFQCGSVELSHSNIHFDFSSQISDMTDEMNNFTEQLNSHDLDKQKYHSCKIVDGLFKQFKESVGISYSIGAKHNVSSRTVLSSFDLSASPSSLFCCLAQFDLLTRSLRKPKKHMSPAHIERAKGFASHSVLQIVALDHARLQNAKHCKTIRSVLLEARRDAAVDDRFSSRLEAVSRGLGDLAASVGSVVELFEGLEEDFAEFDTKFARSATESWAKMRADLSAENHETTFLEVRQSVGEFRKRVLEVSGDHQVHLEPCREGFNFLEELTSDNWSDIKRETKKSLPIGAVSKMSNALQSTLQKMLGGLQQAKNRLREVELRPNEGREPSFKAMERLHASMDCLGLKARSRELNDVLAAKADLERLGFDGTEIAELFAEAAIVAEGCVECADAIIGVVEQGPN